MRASEVEEEAGKAGVKKHTDSGKCVLNRMFWAGLYLHFDCSPFSGCW